MTDFTDIQTRPYTASNILGKSFDAVFSRDFWEFFLPVFLYHLLVMAMGMGSEFITGDPLAETAGVLGDSSAVDPWRPGGSGRYLAFGLINGFVFVGLGILTIQYLLHRIKQTIFAEEVSRSDTFRLTLNLLRGFDFLVTGFFTLVFILIGMIFCLIPGLALFVVFALVPACITYGREAFNFPIAECFQLQKNGRFWTTAAVVLALTLVTIFATLAVTFALGVGQKLPLPGSDPTDFRLEGLYDLFLDYSRAPVQLGSAFLNTLIQTLITLVGAFASAIMYFNYRANSRAPEQVPD